MANRHALGLGTIRASSASSASCLFSFPLWRLRASSAASASRASSTSLLIGEILYGGCLVSEVRRGTLGLDRRAHDVERGVTLSRQTALPSDSKYSYPGGQAVLNHCHHTLPSLLSLPLASRALCHVLSPSLEMCDCSRETSTFTAFTGPPAREHGT